MSSRQQRLNDVQTGVSHGYRLPALVAASPLIFACVGDAEWESVLAGVREPQHPFPSRGVARWVAGQPPRPLFLAHPGRVLAWARRSQGSMQQQPQTHELVVLTEEIGSEIGSEIVIEEGGRGDFRVQGEHWPRIRDQAPFLFGPVLFARDPLVARVAQAPAQIEVVQTPAHA